MIFLKKASLVLLICACCFGCTNNKQSELRVTDSVATDTIQNVNNDAIEEATEEDSIQVNVGIRAVRNEDLRFVAGYPDPDYDYDYDPHYVNVSGILRMDGDSLIEETALSDSAHILIYIRQYPEYDKLFAFSSERDGNRQFCSKTAASKLYVIDTKTLEKHIIDIPFSIIEDDTKYELMPLRTKTNTVFLDGDLYIAYGCINLEKKIRSYFLQNTSNGNLEVVKPAIYRNVVVNNGRFMFHEVDEKIDLTADTVSKALCVPINRHNVYPLFYVNLPLDVDKASTGDKVWTQLCINTDDIMILYFYEKETDESGMYIKKLRIWDKMKKEWSSMVINSDNIDFEYHDGYIMGNFNVSTDDVKILTRRNYAYWTKPMTKYGPYYAPGWNYKSEWQTQAPYSEGDLFLYHVDSQNMIQWNTGHGDSEILMLKDECVYYRVYDKIYKAPIINHKALGEPELIIQNTLIGDVHWMFQIGN